MAVIRYFFSDSQQARTFKPHCVIVYRHVPSKEVKGRKGDFYEQQIKDFSFRGFSGRFFGYVSSAGDGEGLAMERP